MKTWHEIATRSGCGCLTTAALGLGLVVGAGAAGAQPETKVGVACSIRSAALSALYGELTTQVADDWCDELIERLENEDLYPTLSLWRYVREQTPTPAEGSEAAGGSCDHFLEQGSAAGQSTARLHVELCDGSASDTRVRLQLLINDRQAGRWLAQEHWEGVWREPGDPSADPTAEEAPAIFAQTVVEEILESQLGEIITTLKRVPLAQAQRHTSQQTVVSSLPWESFNRLRCSTFVLVCRDSAARWRTLHCVAELVPLSYQPPGEAPYEALAAETDDPLETELDPQLLLLLDYKEPAACDFEIFGIGGG